MKTRPLLTLSVLVLSGCASMIDTYNPEGLPISDLASIWAKPKDVSVASAFNGVNELTAIITEVKDDEGNIVISTGYQGAPETAYLAGGQYQVSIRCDTQGVYNDHTLSLSIVAGEKYRAYCLARFKNVAILGETVQAMLAFVDPVSDLDRAMPANQKIVDSEPNHY